MACSYSGKNPLTGMVEPLPKGNWRPAGADSRGGVIGLPASAPWSQPAADSGRELAALCAREWLAARRAAGCRFVTDVNNFSPAAASIATLTGIRATPAARSDGVEAPFDGALLEAQGCYGKLSEPVPGRFIPRRRGAGAA